MMIWLIGSGQMAVDYSFVLEAQMYEYIVIGRGDSSAGKFTEKTGKDVVTGGLKTFLKERPEVPAAAIVSVGVEQLYDTTLELLRYGVKRILVEKPGALLEEEFDMLCAETSKNHCELYVAYNRRFLASVLAAKEQIEQDGGITSFNFELTEWSHIIGKLDKADVVLNNWFTANSSHVADLAFYLGGKPKELASFTSGGLAWHPASAIFSGAGVSETDALFSYSANWESAGRWSIEMLTSEARYIFRPMEILQVQKRGEINISKIAVDTELDDRFKPGLYKQVEAFLTNQNELLCTISEQKIQHKWFEKMAGYSK